MLIGKNLILCILKNCFFHPCNKPLSSKEQLEAVNVDKAVDYVVSCMNFDGGFGCRPGSESHSGQVSQLVNKHLSNMAISLTWTTLKYEHLSNMNISLI